MNDFQRVLLLIDFLNESDATDAQLDELWSRIQALSIADREELYRGFYRLPRTIYGRLSENCGEMGDYSYY